jgi:hypothetical protein
MEKGNLKWKSEIWEKLRWSEDEGKSKSPYAKSAYEASGK